MAGLSCIGSKEKAQEADLNRGRHQVHLPAVRRVKLPVPHRVHHGRRQKPTAPAKLPVHARERRAEVLSVHLCLPAEVHHQAKLPMHLQEPAFLHAEVKAQERRTAHAPAGGPRMPQNALKDRGATFHPSGRRRPADGLLEACPAIPLSIPSHGMHGTLACSAPVQGAQHWPESGLWRASGSEAGEFTHRFTHGTSLAGGVSAYVDSAVCVLYAYSNRNRRRVWTIPKHPAGPLWA